MLAVGEHMLGNLDERMVRTSAALAGGMGVTVTRQTQIRLIGSADLVAGVNVLHHTCTRAARLFETIRAVWLYEIQQ